MKRIFLPALIAAASLLLGACNTVSVQPLSPPETAKPDPRLLGDWHDLKEHQTFRITARHGGWMHCDVVPDRPPDKVESYDFFPTVIGSNSFLNVKQTGQDEKGRDVSGFTFIRYQINDEKTKFSLWKIDDQAAAAAVRSGKLKGVVHEDNTPVTVGTQAHPDVDVTLTDSTANIVAYIQSADVAALFSDKLNSLVR